MKKSSDTFYFRTVVGAKSTQMKVKVLNFNVEAAAPAEFIAALKHHFKGYPSYADRVFALALMYLANLHRRFDSGHKREKLDACLAAGAGVGEFIVTTLYLAEVVLTFEKTDYCSVRSARAERSTCFGEEVCVERAEMWEQRGELLEASDAAHHYSVAVDALVAALTPSRASQIDLAPALRHACDEIPEIEGM